MPINGYFDTVFAVDGDLNTIPDATQPSGTVSYQQGFPVGYSTAVSSGGFNVPRTAFNQALFDITSALQQYQQNGTPPFITSTMNGGSPYSYGQYATVLNGGIAYMSLVSSNTDTPPSSKWIPVSLFAAATESVTGTNHTYAAADNNQLVLRSNSGTTMIDTLPGTSPGVLAKGWSATIVNNDSSALYLLTVGSGANFNGSSSSSIVLGPGQRATIFSDGTNYWAKEAPGRIRMAANTSFFVSTTGSDSANTGLTAASPFATIQHALNYIANNVDLAGLIATIQLADGTYSAGVLMTQPFVGGGPANVVINGNSVTPTNVVLSTSGVCLQATGSGVGFSVQNLKMTSSAAHCILIQFAATILCGAGLVFGTATSGFHITSNTNGQIFIQNSYAITGGAQAHIFTQLSASSYESSGITVTLTGTPAFSVAFAEVIDGSLIAQGVTFSGSATGVRYLASLNGTINTNGGGANYFPGNSAGSTASGGQYA
jgi:hypothetical protein